MIKEMRAAGQALTQGLREEWDGYGKIGQRIVVGGAAAIATALALTFAATEPKCPAHPVIGVGNPEFRCPAPK